MDYKASGVDIDAGNEAVRRIRGLARSTFTPAVLSDIGSFGGLFRLEPGVSERIPNCLDARFAAGQRRCHMKGVVVQAVAQHFRIDVGAAPLRVFQFLDHE